MSDVMHDTAVAPESAAAPGPGQCQVRTTSLKLAPTQIRQLLDFTERCPNQAEALIWYSCPNGHEYPEEVCSGHIDPPGFQWCGHCAADGLAVGITLSFIGWI